MATKGPISREDLLCPQCSRFYSLPVLLKCGHNFCKACLSTFWKWKGCRNCPVCGTVSASERPPINLTLKLEVDKYQAERTNISQGLCSVHNEELKVFCSNDEEPICLICQLSSKHKVHECNPVEEAATQKKRETSTRLDSLNKKLRILQKTQQQWEETKAYIQTQAQENEAVIKEEFQKLHQFLREEERSRLDELKRERENKTQVLTMKLETIKEQIKTLSSAITEVEKALRAPNVPFLQEYKQTKKSVTCKIPQPECVRDILINSAQNLGSLRFEVWKSMINYVKYVPVTLDPNTAHYNLTVSPDLSSVRYGRKQLLPDNPERCTNHVCLLGAEGFASGKHKWTVEVGQSQNWQIGLALESIKRKSTSFIKPAEGFWVIGLYDGNSLCAGTSPRTKLTMKQKLLRITVELDYDKGKVVFINAANSTTIHTFKDKFTEKVFPYFSPGLSENGTNFNSLTICPSEIIVNININ